MSRWSKALRDRVIRPRPDIPFSSVNDDREVLAVNSAVFVQSHVLAYIFTLDKNLVRSVPYNVHVQEPSFTTEERVLTHRSMHFPSSLRPTQSHLNPLSAKLLTYHGFNAAERNNTRPPMRSTLFRARTCSFAAGWCGSGSNQSIESMRMAILSVDGVMRAMTSIIASVCMRRPSKAVGLESLAYALAPR